MPRQRRIVYRNTEVGSVYHCVSRTVNKEFLWTTQAQEIFRRQLRKAEAFCGVEILAYCIMSNHFHLMVRVVSGRSTQLTDWQLLEKVTEFYTHPKDLPILLAWRQALLSVDPEVRLKARNALLARMDDLSNFMKLLKQRFSIWFNRTHERWGTHWGERFQSVLVEPSRQAMCMVAAYIALNPVRAGICAKPGDYRFSSYSEAITGNQQARQGVQWIVKSGDANESLAYFTSLLQRMQGDSDEPNAPGKDAAEIVSPGANSERSANLFTRGRFFVRGLFLGTRIYVEDQIRLHRVKLTRRTKPRTVRFDHQHVIVTLRGVESSVQRGGPAFQGKVSPQ